MVRSFYGNITALESVRTGHTVLTSAEQPCLPIDQIVTALKRQRLELLPCLLRYSAVLLVDDRFQGRGAKVDILHHYPPKGRTFRWAWILSGGCPTGITVEVMSLNGSNQQRSQFELKLIASVMFIFLRLCLVAGRRVVMSRVAKATAGQTKTEEHCQHDEEHNGEE